MELISFKTINGTNIYFLLHTPEDKNKKSFITELKRGHKDEIKTPISMDIFLQDLAKTIVKNNTAMGLEKVLTSLSERHFLKLKENVNKLTAVN